MLVSKRRCYEASDVCGREISPNNSQVEQCLDDIHASLGDNPFAECVRRSAIAVRRVLANLTCRQRPTGWLGQEHVRMRASPHSVATSWHWDANGLHLVLSAEGSKRSMMHRLLIRQLVTDTAAGRSRKTFR